MCVKWQKIHEDFSWYQNENSESNIAGESSWLVNMPSCDDVLNERIQLAYSKPLKEGTWRLGFPEIRYIHASVSACGNPRAVLVYVLGWEIFVNEFNLQSLLRSLSERYETTYPQKYRLIYNTVVFLAKMNK